MGNPVDLRTPSCSLLISPSPCTIISCLSAGPAGCSNSCNSSAPNVSEAPAKRSTLSLRQVRGGAVIVLTVTQLSVRARIPGLVMAVRMASIKKLRAVEGSVLAAGLSCCQQLLRSLFLDSCVSKEGLLEGQLNFLTSFTSEPVKFKNEGEHHS